MTNKLESFSKLFKKVDGIKVFKQYFRARVLFFAIFQIFCQGTSKKSLEIVRNSVDNKILSKLRKKYKDSILKYKGEFVNLKKNEIRYQNVVWIFWLQGLDSAPPIVKLCIQSVKENVGNRNVIILSESNLADYITFPKYIQDKIDKGIITKTHMSDLLRLELLNTYGGTWVDATVFFSGANIPDYMFNSELFMFQKLKPGLDGHPKAISSWFITSKPNNPILVLSQKLLYDYWKSHDFMIDYFLLHDFIQLSIEAYPEIWNKVVPFSSSTPHMLLLRLFNEYVDEIWSGISEQVSIHKLSYKFDEEDFDKSGTFYKKVVKKGT